MEEGDTPVANRTGSQNLAGNRTGAPRSPERTPDFLSSVLALAHFMRLSLMKAAHAGVGGAPCRKSGYVGRKRRGEAPPNAFIPNCSRSRVAPYPRFPVEVNGFRELHAPFLKERRTRGLVQGCVQEIRGISLVFREIWDTAARLTGNFQISS
jgi:hypothetical protein